MRPGVRDLDDHLLHYREGGRERGGGRGGDPFTFFFLRGARPKRSSVIGKAACWGG